jgi:hypothetical protein
MTVPFMAIYGWHIFYVFYGWHLFRLFFMDGTFFAFFAFFAAPFSHSLALRLFLQSGLVVPDFRKRDSYCGQEAEN